MRLKKKLETLMAENVQGEKYISFDDGCGISVKWTAVRFQNRFENMETSVQTYDCIYRTFGIDENCLPSTVVERVRNMMANDQWKNEIDSRAQKNFEERFNA